MLSVFQVLGSHFHGNASSFDPDHCGPFNLADHFQGQFASPVVGPNSATTDADLRRCDQHTGVVHEVPYHAILGRIGSNRTPNR